MYAKLINNRLQPAPKQVQYNGNTIFNPPDSVLSDLGYLPVVYTVTPTAHPVGQHYESGWEQTDAEITQVWTLVDDPGTSEPELTIADLEAAIKEAINNAD